MVANILNNRFNTRGVSRGSQSRRAQRLVPRAVAAPELSPKEAGVEGAANQLDALKQMSKIVADSGVRVLPLLASPAHNSRFDAWSHLMLAEALNDLHLAFIFATLNHLSILSPGQIIVNHAASDTFLVKGSQKVQTKNRVQIQMRCNASLHLCNSWG